LDSARSALGFWTVRLALALLLVGFGSYSMAALMLAVLVMALPAVPPFTRAVRVSVAVAPLASVPTVHTPPP